MYVTRACCHWRRIHSKVAIAPARAMRLFVVCGDDSYRSHRATLSPAGASISAALPPGLGLELSLPRQLSSAWTSTRSLPSGAPATSGLDDHRDVGVLQDLLGVRHHHGAGAALRVAHVGPGEQGVAMRPLDHARHDLAGPPRFHVRDERDPLRSEEHTSELQSHVNLVCRLLLEK